MDRNDSDVQETLLENIDITINILDRFRNDLLDSDKFEDFIVGIKNSVQIPLNEIPTGLIQWAVTGNTAFLRSGESLIFLINSVKRVPVNILANVLNSTILNFFDSPKLELLKELTPEQHKDLITLVQTLQTLDKILEE